MIWFACKSCGKRHGRAEQLSGTMVFCDCGHGNRVPWSSTVAEPEPEEARPAPPPSPRPPSSLPPRDEPPPMEFPRLRRSRERRRPNPAYCLNHEETPKEAVCEVCRASFCAACVVAMQGQTLCGPCKNFRVRGMSQPARLSPLSIVAFVLALVTTVVSLVLTLFAMGMAAGVEKGIFAALVFCLIALVLAGGESAIGWLALRQIDRQPALGGRALAMTGAAAGLSGVVWSLAVALFSIIKEAQG